MLGLIPNDDEDLPSWQTLITDAMMNPSQPCFVLMPLPTKTQVSYTMTAQATSLSCHLTATYAFCHVPLQDQRHLCISYPWARLREHFSDIQEKL